MTDREITLAAIRRRGWEIVKLKGTTKKPAGRHWDITTNADQVAAWLDAGDNIGLVCHERTGMAVLDPDRLSEWADMIDMLGQPSPAWVLTGSGKLHYYVQWMPHLPAKLTWRDTIIGEIQRGPGHQQVVLPPSRHPDTGRPYRWLGSSFQGFCEVIDPVSDPLPRLPGLWVAYFSHESYAREHRQR